MQCVFLHSVGLLGLASVQCVFLHSVGLLGLASVQFYFVWCGCVFLQCGMHRLSVFVRHCTTP